VRARKSARRAKRYVKGAMVFVWYRDGSLDWGCCFACCCDPG
jgi:hypothetical protein